MFLIPLRLIVLSIGLLVIPSYVLAKQANDALIYPSVIKNLDAILIARNAAYKKFPWMKDKKYFAEYNSGDQHIMVVFSLDPTQKQYLGSPPGQPIVEVQLAKKDLSVLKVYIAK